MDPAAAGEMNVGSTGSSKLECAGHVPLLTGSQTARNGLSFGLKFSSEKQQELYSLWHPPWAPVQWKVSFSEASGRLRGPCWLLPSKTSNPSWLQKLPSTEDVWAVELHHQH